MKEEIKKLSKENVEEFDKIIKDNITLEVFMALYNLKHLKNVHITIDDKTTIVLQDEILSIYVDKNPNHMMNQYCLKTLYAHDVSLGFTELIKKKND